MLLREVAFTRSGDKGDVLDVSLFARLDGGMPLWEALAEQVTAERVKALYGDYVTGEVVRYDVPNLLAFKFVCAGALGGGGPASLRADNLGKSLGSALLRLTIELPEGSGGAERYTS
jgi:hypothetical protein